MGNLENTSGFDAYREFLMMIASPTPFFFLLSGERNLKSLSHLLPPEMSFFSGYPIWI